MSNRPDKAKIAKLRLELRNAPKPPRGWVTADQLAKRLGISDRWAREILGVMAEAGWCKVQDYPIVTGKVCRAVAHYQIPEKFIKAYGLKLPR